MSQPNLTKLLHRHLQAIIIVSRPQHLLLRITIVIMNPHLYRPHLLATSMNITRQLQSPLITTMKPQFLRHTVLMKLPQHPQLLIIVKLHLLFQQLFLITTRPLPSSQPPLLVNLQFFHPLLVNLQLFHPLQQQFPQLFQAELLDHQLLSHLSHHVDVEMERRT